MIATLKSFLTGCLTELSLGGFSRPYRAARANGPDDIGNVFFGELPRDFLKDNDFAAQLLLLQDRKRRDGRTIARVRNAQATRYTFTRRRYRREILVRCILYAARFEDLWGETDRLGLVDQLEATIAGTRMLADSGNNAVTVELQDEARPWTVETAADRQKRRAHVAIVRISFVGGVHTQDEIPIVQSIDFNPQVL